MVGSEAQRLLERLIGDPVFREHFEVDPAGTARAAGFDRLADDLEVDHGDPMLTLEMRESKSSLAGALMATAAEVVGFVALGGTGHAADAAHHAPATRRPDLARAPGAADSPAARLAARAERVAGRQDVSPTAPPPVSPDDFTGEADDEDAGADEQDGSNEIEPDEGSSGEAGSGEAGSDEGSSDEGSSEEEDEEDEDDDEDEDEEDEDEEDEDEEDEDEYDDDEDANDGESDGDSGGDGAQGQDGPAEAPSDQAGVGAIGDDPADLAPTVYPGDGAPQEDIAAWMAAAAQRRGLPPELPVMASLVESGLKNVDYGDADSVGLFQMRMSIWNQGPYQGYADRPELQLRWFLDHAEAVKQQRLAAGASIDPRHYGEWIADVERPAEQYRGRYQLRLDEARSLLEQAGATPTPPAGSVDNDAHVLRVPGLDEVGGDAADLTSLRAGIVAHARSFVGTPYVWGGTSPSGFDCSGFVQYVYKEMGVELPRVSYQQANAGQRIPLNALRPGDLVAWDNSSRNNGADHIAIYIGHGQIAEAPSPGIDLRIRQLGSDEGAWAVRILGRKG